MGYSSINCCPLSVAPGMIPPQHYNLLCKWVSFSYGQRNVWAESQVLEFRSLSISRAEWTYWTTLIIQYGVTVSYVSYVKCYVKTELLVMGCNGNALRRGPEHPKPQV